MFKKGDYVLLDLQYISKGGMFAEKGGKYWMKRKDVISSVREYELMDRFASRTNVVTIGGFSLIYEEGKVVESNLNREEVSGIEIEKVELEEWCKY